MVQNSSKIISIKTHARLHFGFFDLHGGLGRRFGSLGVALERPATEMEMSVADDFTIVGDIDVKGRENIINSIQLLQKELNLEVLCKLNVRQQIPSHAGFGSGTQMALCLVALINQLYDLNLSQTQISLLSGRGARSGIGLGTFFLGGVIVDAGRGDTNQIPPVIARVSFPEEWRILLIFDHSKQGVHGEQEISAFQNSPEFSSSLAEKLCRHVLMQALPALHEHDLTNFGVAVRALQIATGKHFANTQGGLYASQKVEEVLNYMENQGVTCFGQSSWGPTGFAVFESEAEANSFLTQLNDHFNFQTDLKFMLTKAANIGATVITK